MTTFVNVGDRVDIYQKPYTHEEHEGCGVVHKVHGNSDMESAYVDVKFDDDDPTDLPYARWILPTHLQKQPPP